MNYFWTMTISSIKSMQKKKVINRFIRELCKQKYWRVLYNVNILGINVHYALEQTTEKRLDYSIDCGECQ